MKDSGFKYEIYKKIGLEIIEIKKNMDVRSSEVM
jgi:hypothetical protein